MLAAVRRIEDTQESGAARSFWWVATGFLSALAEGAVQDEANAKQLARASILQIRRLLDGSRNVAERLVRDALYFVATADSSSDAVPNDQERLPVAGSWSPARMPRRRFRRRRCAGSCASSSRARRTWNKFCAGTAQALPLFKEHANSLSTLVDQLGTPISAVSRRRSRRRRSGWPMTALVIPEALAMEIATAILLTQNAQENFQRLGNDFAHQVDVTVARIHGCIAGNLPPPVRRFPCSTRCPAGAGKAADRQVAKGNQKQSCSDRQVPDNFFRDAAKRSELEGLDVPLKQVIGALTMMRQDAAVSALRDCADEISSFCRYRI